MPTVKWAMLSRHRSRVRLGSRSPHLFVDKYWKPDGKPNMISPLFLNARKEFLTALAQSVLTTNDKGIPSNADVGSKLSIEFATEILSRIGSETKGAKLSGQSAGKQFEDICTAFLQRTFLKLDHLRPGNWEIKCIGGRNKMTIAHYEQYEHLIQLQRAAKKDRNLAAALQSDYTITPDIVIARLPIEDLQINQNEALIDENVATRSSLRASYNPLPLLHASVSCKWTIRSDRAQNARSEALNLVRNRKGHLPHIVVVTGEPLPSRLASLALGTGTSIACTILRCMSYKRP